MEEDGKKEEEPPADIPGPEDAEVQDFEGMMLLCPDIDGRSKRKKRASRKGEKQRKEKAPKAGSTGADGSGDEESSEDELLV